MSTDTETSTDVRHVYVCTNGKCGDRDARQVMGYSPSAWRFITGKAMRCDECGRPIQYRGVEGDEQ